MDITYYKFIKLLIWAAERDGGWGGGGLQYPEGWYLLHFQPFSLWISCKKTGSKSGIFQGLWDFLKIWWKMRFFERLWSSMHECETSLATTMSFVGANLVKFDQKTAPKSMKNTRFGSGFLAWGLKIDPQHDLIGKNSYSSHRAKFWAL